MACDDTEDKTSVHAGVVCPLAISLGPQESFSSSPIHDRGETLGANHSMEKKEVLDGRCIVSLTSQ